MSGEVEVYKSHITTLKKHTLMIETEAGETQQKPHHNTSEAIIDPISVGRTLIAI